MWLSFASRIQSWWGYISYREILLYWQNRSTYFLLSSVYEHRDYIISSFVTNGFYWSLTFRDEFLNVGLRNQTHTKNVFIFFVLHRDTSDLHYFSDLKRRSQLWFYTMMRYFLRVYPKTQPVGVFRSLCNHDSGSQITCYSRNYTLERSFSDFLENTKNYL